MDRSARSPLRLLAPAAIVVFALALVLVVASSSTDSGSKGSGDKSEKSDENGDRTSTGDGNEGELPQETYTVKAGDTLEGISDKTGIPIDKLQELNPDLDPQALISGQKIKLRE